MPLKLVTGPANAAKAGEVLGGLRARLDDDPILVVPTLGDVEHAQRELAERGAVFGARVLRFTWLFEEIAARAGYGQAMASDFQRELLVEEAVRGTKLSVLAESASQPGFARAAARFVAELGRIRPPVEPARFTQCASERGPGRARGARTRTRWRAYTAAIAPGSTGSDSSTRSCSRGARSTPCVPSARPGGARRCSCTASTISTDSSSTRSTRSQTGPAPT